MDARHEIVAEAETVTEARQRAERQVPRGMHVLSVKENWPARGTARAAGDEPTAAQQQARALVPVGARVVSERVLDAGDEVSVYAADAAGAAAQLHARYGAAVDAEPSHLTHNGTRADSATALADRPLVGLDEVLYRAVLLKPFAEIAYASRARVALTFGTPAPRRPFKR
jgi:hypothetical protein